jgi:hypothetical protein
MKSMIIAWGVAGGLALAATAGAADRLTSQASLTPAASPGVTPVGSQPAAMSEAELDAVSAGAEPGTLTLANTQLNATNSGNSITASSVTSGGIAFSGNALSGFSGVGNFVMNTGNNNNLQGSITVNIGNVPVGR